MKRYQIIALAVLMAAGLSPTTYAGRDDWRSGRDNRSGDWNRRNRCGRDCNYFDGTFATDYLPNNYNYLGYPPWYRLNYYTPWMSDYRNGTAWSRIPTSHAAEAYGLPPTFNTMPSGYYAWLAANGGGNINTAYASPAGVDGFPNPGMTPQQPAYNTQPAGQLGAGMDIVVSVQRELRKRGFYQGLINGVSDPSTRAAIRAYEARAGLPATGGVIGIDLLRSLGMI